MHGFTQERIELCHRVDGTYPRRMVNNGRSASPRLLRTALRPRQTLGLTEITHPFHPLRGQRFIVLKIRKVSGVEILSLRHTEMGSLAIPRDWTDWAPPGTSVEPINGQRSLLVDTLGLLALAELVGSLKRKK
jgi:hypothetical protein